MLDIMLTLKPALSGAKSGMFGMTPPVDGGIRLEALAEGHVIQVLAAPGAGDIGDASAEAGGDNRYRVRPAGPGQWFIVGEAPVSSWTLALMQGDLGDVAVLVDQSHGRARLAISGKQVERVLAKGTGIDLDIKAFPVGRSAITLLGHIGVHLTRTGDTAFEVLVMRSYAVSLWDDLIAKSLEFGVTASAS